MSREGLEPSTYGLKVRYTRFGRFFFSPHYRQQVKLTTRIITGLEIFDVSLRFYLSLNHVGRKPAGLLLGWFRQVLNEGGKHIHIAQGGRPFPQVKPITGKGCARSRASGEADIWEG